MKVKTKCLISISCLAAAGLIASPALSAPQTKPMKTAQAGTQRVNARTSQMMTTHNRSVGSSYKARQYAGTRQYAAAPQYNQKRYYSGRGYSGNYYSSGRNYYGSSRNYYSAGPSYYGNSGYYGAGVYPSYSYYSGWPSYSYYSGWPSSYYGYGYPYSYYSGSYYSGYPYGYSYYQPGYSYNGGTVAAVQRRLGELGYYHGVVDGIMGPQTRAAIAAFENRHGMFADGVITGRLLNRMGLS